MTSFAERNAEHMARHLKMAMSIEEQISAVEFERIRDGLSSVSSTFDEYTFDKLSMVVIFRLMVKDGKLPTFAEFSSKYLGYYSDRLTRRGIALSDNIPIPERKQAWEGQSVSENPVSYGEYATARLMRSYAELLSQEQFCHYFSGTSRNVASGVAMVAASIALDVSGHDMVLVRRFQAHETILPDPYVISVRMATATTNADAQFRDKTGRGNRRSLRELASVRMAREIDAGNRLTRRGDINIYNPGLVGTLDDAIDSVVDAHPRSCVSGIAAASDWSVAASFFRMVDEAVEADRGYNPCLSLACIPDGNPQ